MPTTRSLALAVLSICLVLGGAVHLFDIASGGMFPYRFAPLPVNVYWTSLAALDLLAAFLLWRRISIGLVLSVAIMLSDVAVNSYVTSSSSLRALRHFSYRRCSWGLYSAVSAFFGRATSIFNIWPVTNANCTCGLTRRSTRTSRVRGRAPAAGRRLASIR
jgi:hypothetical protein